MRLRSTFGLLILSAGALLLLAAHCSAAEPQHLLPGDVPAGVMSDAEFAERYPGQRRPRTVLLDRHGKPRQAATCQTGECYEMLARTPSELARVKARHAAQRPSCQGCTLPAPMAAGNPRRDLIEIQRDLAEIQRRLDALLTR